MQDLNQLWIRRILKLPLLFFRFIVVKKQARKASQELANEKIQVVYSNTSSIVFRRIFGTLFKKQNKYGIFVNSEKKIIRLHFSLERGI